MSAEAFSWAMRQETGSPTCKLVLLALGNHAHADGTGCWPRIQTLARFTELSARAVQKALRRLENELGLIVAEPRITESGQRSNNYRLAVDGGRSSVGIRSKSSSESAKEVRARPQEIHPARAPVSPGPPHLVQGHIDSNRQNEPSSNFAPKRAHPLSGRALQLAKMIGEARYQAWFAEAEFLEGNPLRIIMPTLMKRNWVDEHFAAPIRAVFGAAVIIEARPSLRDEPQRYGSGLGKVDPGGG